MAGCLVRAGPATTAAFRFIAADHRREEVVGFAQSSDNLDKDGTGFGLGRAMVSLRKDAESFQRPRVQIRHGQRFHDSHLSRGGPAPRMPPMIDLCGSCVSGGPALPAAGSPHGRANGRTG